MQIFPQCSLVIFTAVITSSREKTTFKFCDWKKVHLTLLVSSDVWELGAAVSPYSPWATQQPGWEYTPINLSVCMGLITWLPGYVNICILRILSVLYQQQMTYWHQLEMYQCCHPSRPPTALAVMISLSGICIVEDIIMRIYFEEKEFPYLCKSLEPWYTLYYMWSLKHLCLNWSTGITPGGIKLFSYSWF